MAKTTRENPDTKQTEYWDGEYWIDERWVCNRCIEREDINYRFADERYSFGYYAGKYCDECWKESGYRDATDPDAEFSEMDAGESLHGEEN